MFGFEKKEIEIFLEKYNYSPGEFISGKISIKLSKPIHAKKLKVALIGEKITVMTEKDSNRKTNTTEEKTYVYNFQISLDGEKEYTEGEYEFQIKIPQNILQGVSLPKIGIEDMINSMQLPSSYQSMTNWYVVANLDVPMGFDISHKIQINIG